MEPRWVTADDDMHDNMRLESLTDRVFADCAAYAKDVFGPSALKLDELAIAGVWARQMNVVLSEFVESAWEEGATWTQIGDALGISRQAAQKRFDRDRALGRLPPIRMPENKKRTD